MRISERGWNVLCHLSALAGVIPGGNIIGPLMVWLHKKDDAVMHDDQGRESLNFQISMTIVMIFAYFLRVIWIGKPLMIALVLVDLYWVVYASVQVYRGVQYRYPVNFRLIR
jgi:uncharacterized Tic20 family protein